MSRIPNGNTSTACAVVVLFAASIGGLPAIGQAQSSQGLPPAPAFLTAPLQQLAAPPAAARTEERERASDPAAGQNAAEPARPSQTGRIAYYGRKFAGRRTAGGERFDPEAMTMAHRSLPFGTRVRVTNLENGKSVVLRVNDRTPSGGDRIGDVSQAAAEQLEMTRAGVIEARLEVLRVRTVR